MRCFRDFLLGGHRGQDSGDFSLSIGLGMHLCPPDELEDLAEEREDCLSLFRLLLCNPNLDKWHKKLSYTYLQAKPVITF